MRLLFDVGCTYSGKELSLNKALLYFFTILFFTVTFIFRKVILNLLILNIGWKRDPLFLFQPYLIIRQLASTFRQILLYAESISPHLFTCFANALVECRIYMRTFRLVALQMLSKWNIEFSFMWSCLIWKSLIIRTIWGEVLKKNGPFF